MARVRDESRAVAKLQLAGPMTLQWTLRTVDGQIPPAGALTHVSRTVLARSLAMVDALQTTGANPLFFIDEPGLYAFSRTQPGRIMLLQELRIMIMALKKRGARVGLHCCSDADWGALMGLGLDVLGIERSAVPALAASGRGRPWSPSYRWAGGWRWASSPPATATRPPRPRSSWRRSSGSSAAWSSISRRAGRSSRRSWGAALLLTPACGMAFLSEAEAAAISGQLAAFRALYRAA